MTYEEATTAIRAGRFARPKSWSRGWYVWAAKDGSLYAHNPYHGSSPSGRDHAYTPNAKDRADAWREIAV